MLVLIVPRSRGQIRGSWYGSSRPEKAVSLEVLADQDELGGLVVRIPS